MNGRTDTTKKPSIPKIIYFLMGHAAEGGEEIVMGILHFGCKMGLLGKGRSRRKGGFIGKFQKREMMRHE